MEDIQEQINLEKQSNNIKEMETNLETDFTDNSNIVETYPNYIETQNVNWQGEYVNQNVNWQSQYINQNKGKSKTALFLFAVLLGLYGGHHFYAGNILAGVVQLVLYLCASLPLGDFSVVSYLVVLVWLIIDLIKIGMNKYKDRQNNYITGKIERGILIAVISIFAVVIVCYILLTLFIVFTTLNLTHPLIVV